MYDSIKYIHHQYVKLYKPNSGFCNLLKTRQLTKDTKL